MIFQCIHVYYITWKHLIYKLNTPKIISVFESTSVPSTLLIVTVGFHASFQCLMTSPPQATNAQSFFLTTHKCTITAHGAKCKTFVGWRWGSAYIYMNCCNIHTSRYRLVLVIALKPGDNQLVARTLWPPLRCDNILWARTKSVLGPQGQL